MKIRIVTQDDQNQLIALWNSCGLVRPWNDPEKDIARKRHVQPELFIVGTIDGKLMASAMGGYDGHRGNIYYLAVSPEHQGNGFGPKMVKWLAARFEAMGCPKINVMIRAENSAVSAFYDRLGFVRETTLLCSQRLISDL